MKKNHNEIKICLLTRKILQFSFLWPSNEDELNPGITYKYRLFIFFLIMWPIYVFATIYFGLSLKYIQYFSFEDSSIVIAGYGTLYMIVAYLHKQKALANLYRDMSNFQRFGKPPNLETEMKKLDMWVIILFVYSFIGISSNSFYHLLGKPSCMKLLANSVLTTNGCGLTVNAWLPFETDYFPVFQISFIYTLLACHLLIKMPLHLGFNAYEMAHHIVLRIKHLKIMILDCLSRDYETSYIQLKTCILYHNEILEYASRLNDVFSTSMFGHMTFTALICAALELQILTGEHLFSNIAHFCGWIISLSISCAAGQHLLDEAQILQEALWASKWYEADGRLQKMVLFMLTRSQNEFYLRAGPFGILSYDLIISILKTSYSVLCVFTS